MNTAKISRLSRAAFNCACPVFAAFLAAASADVRAEVVITETFTPNLNVPDLGFVTDTRSLGATLDSISRISVSLDIGVRGTGGFNGELVATLHHGGQTAALLNQAGRDSGFSKSFGYADSGGFNVTLADAAANDIHTYQDQATPASGNPVTGAWQPDGRLGAEVISSTPRDGMLSVFTGQSTSGNWSLVVGDTAFGETLHRLNSWSLTVAGTPGANPVSLRDSALVTASPAGETFSGLVTMDGKATFSGGEVSLDGGIWLKRSSELRVDTSVRVSTISDSDAPSSLIKTGPGTLTIGGTASHTDRTVVSEGALVVNGEITHSTTTVEMGGVLSGSGKLAKLELSGGILSPGSSPGTLSSGDQIWNGGSGLIWEINNAEGMMGADAGWDYLDIDGSLNINADTGNKFRIMVQTLTLGNDQGLLANFDPSVAYTWTLAEAVDGIEGFSASAIELDLEDFENDYTGTFGLVMLGDDRLALRYTPVPEPAETAAVIASLLGAFAAYRQTRRRSAQLPSS